MSVKYAAAAGSFNTIQWGWYPGDTLAGPPGPGDIADANGFVVGINGDFGCQYQNTTSGGNFYLSMGSQIISSSFNPVISGGQLGFCVQVTGGSTLTVVGSVVGQGISVEVSSTLILNGSASTSPGVDGVVGISSSGTVVMTGNVTTGGSNVGLDLTSGTTSILGDVIVPVGTAESGSGIIISAGATVTLTGVLRVAAGVGVYLYSNTLNWTGSLNWTGGTAIQSFSGSAINFTPGPTDTVNMFGTTFLRTAAGAGFGIRGPYLEV